MSESRHKKQLVGTVVSNSMDKSVTVVVRRQIKHPQYQKFVRREKKYMAHDSQNECEVGDQVMIQECRPLSKSKRWTVAKTITKAVKV
jgi:small subunit ribosomal protein S17